MNDEKILDIANEHLNSGGSYRFHKEDLIAFAQSLLEADREKRKPLTDDEMNDELVKANVYQSVTAFARAVERRING